MKIIKLSMLIWMVVACINSMEHAENLDADAKNIRASSNNLDTTFGVNGIVTTAFEVSSGTFNQLLPSIHIQTRDGKTVIAGDAYKQPQDDHSPESVVALVRYNIDGTLDDSFGHDGKVLLPVAKNDCFAMDLALQADGKIIVATRIFDRGEFYGDAALLRLNHDGTLDKSFGDSGITREKNVEYNWSNFFRVAIQQDGKIVACGNKGVNTPNEKLDHCTFFIARFNDDGTLDTSFGNNGHVNTIIQVSNFSKKRTSFREADEAWSLCLQKDGKIIVVGHTEDAEAINPADIEMTSSSDCAIVKYDNSGNLDTTFGPDRNGMIVTSLSTCSNFFVDCLVQPDGNIIALGTSRNSQTNKDEFALVRYTSNGELDKDFGTNGIVLTALGTEHAQAKNLLLQQDGKILVTGHVQHDDHKKFTIARYDSDGSLDSSFGTDQTGILVIAISPFDNRSFSMALQSNQTLIVAGDSFNGKNYDFALARYKLIN